MTTDFNLYVCACFARGFSRTRPQIKNRKTAAVPALCISLTNCTKIVSFSHDVVGEASRRCSKPATVAETRQICASGEECVSVVGSLNFFLFVKNHFQVGPRNVSPEFRVSECGLFCARRGEPQVETVE